jgi:hypothetical protein
MTRAYTVREEKRDGTSELQELAKEQVAFHTRPSPQAEWHAPHPFPSRLIRGLWFGVLVGGILGAIFGILLVQNLLFISGWEMLYSMGPFTFVAFWTLMGIAIGLALIGVAVIVLTSTEIEEIDREEYHG